MKSRGTRLVSSSVLFHPPDRSDWVSQVCSTAGSLLLPGDKLDLMSHVSLRVDSKIYEFTWKGVTVNNASRFTRPVAVTIDFNMSPMAHDLVAERLKTMIRSGAKLQWQDLVKVAWGRPPKGLICTDFIECALGGDPSNLTPAELFQKYELTLKEKTLWLSLDS